MAATFVLGEGLGDSSAERLKGDFASKLSNLKNAVSRPFRPLQV